MATWAFYLLLVFFSSGVKFSLLWFLIALFFGASETAAYRYKKR